MKADFYVSNMVRNLFWIWLGLGGYCTVCAKPGNREDRKKEEKVFNFKLPMEMRVFASV